MREPYKILVENIINILLHTIKPYIAYSLHQLIVIVNVNQAVVCFCRKLIKSLIYKHDPMHSMHCLCVLRVYIVNITLTFFKYNLLFILRYYVL